MPESAYLEHLVEQILKVFLLINNHDCVLLSLMYVPVYLKKLRTHHCLDKSLKRKMILASEKMVFCQEQTYEIINETIIEMARNNHMS